MKNKLKKLVMVSLVFVASMLFFGENGNAYIDPSVMTYMIQVVAGIAVAVGAVAGIYIRRIKRELSQKFGIDENKNKEVESDDIFVDDYVKL